ncbi:MAG: hypothetical protein ACRD3W_24125, partial [Terriglobales bacterium]
LCDSNPVAAIDVLHVLGEGVVVQGDFRMVVRPQYFRAFQAYGAITEGGAFGAAGDNSDVLRHELPEEGETAAGWQHPATLRVS